MMSDPTHQQLRQAYELIKAKKRQEALQILVPILRADENNANAWWLLANALTDPNDVREALENVLRLRPDHENARKMLQKLNERFPPPPPEPEPEAEEIDFGEAAAEDIFATTEREPSAAEPFGGPAEPFGAPSGRAADPFAEAAEPFGAPSRARATGEDPFGAPGAGAAAAHRPAARQARSGGSNTLVIVLAVVGGLLILGCLACAVVAYVLPAAGISLLGGVFDQAVGTLEAEGFVETLEAVGTVYSGGDIGEPLPPNVNRRGNLGYGDSRQDTLGQSELHGWTFSGNGGDLVVIDALGSDPNNPLDTYVELYGPDNRLLTSDDDSGEDFNAHLEHSLPASGTYTVVVRGFGGSGGSYELRLSRR